MTVPSITLEVRMSSGARLSVELNDSLEAVTVLQVKEEISSLQTDCPPERQRLIYKGRILDDERTLSDYGVVPGSTLHLVKSSSASRAAAIHRSGDDSTYYLLLRRNLSNPFSAPAIRSTIPPMMPLVLECQCHLEECRLRNK